MYTIIISRSQKVFHNVPAECTPTEVTLWVGGTVLLTIGLNTLHLPRFGQGWKASNQPTQLAVSCTPNALWRNPISVINLVCAILDLPNPTDRPAFLRRRESYHYLAACFDISDIQFSGQAKITFSTRLLLLICFNFSPLLSNEATELCSFLVSLLFNSVYYLPWTIFIKTYPHLEHGRLRRPQLDEGWFPGGHFHDGAAQGPDVGRGAVATMALVDHLGSHVLKGA